MYLVTTPETGLTLHLSMSFLCAHTLLVFHFPGTLPLLALPYLQGCCSFLQPLIDLTTSTLNPPPMCHSTTRVSVPRAHMTLPLSCPKPHYLGVKCKFLGWPRRPLPNPPASPPPPLCPSLLSCLSLHTPVLPTSCVPSLPPCLQLGMTPPSFSLSVRSCRKPAPMRHLAPSAGFMKDADCLGAHLASFSRQ